MLEKINLVNETDGKKRTLEREGRSKKKRNEGRRAKREEGGRQTTERAKRQGEGEKEVVKKEN